MRPFYWDVEKQRGLDLRVASAVPKLPSMHRMWKLIVSEWIAVNTGPRVSRPVTFRVVSTALRKNPFSRWNGGKVWITHLARGWEWWWRWRERTGKTRCSFFFLFCLVCCVYQWDGDIRVWNGIPGVCLMTFLAVWRRWTDVFVLTEYFHALICGTEKAKVRFDHCLSYSGLIEVWMKLRAW